MPGKTVQMMPLYGLKLFLWISKSNYGSNGATLKDQAEVPGGYKAQRYGQYTWSQTWNSHCPTSYRVGITSYMHRDMRFGGGLSAEGDPESWDFYWTYRIKAGFIKVTEHI